MQLSNPFTLPDDGPRWACALAAVLVAVAAQRKLQPRSRLVVPVAGVTAAALSAVYVAFYLRGGPRIIDATAYWLQARALSEGMFAFPLPEPEHAVLGRFLVRTTIDGAPAASVIFPPGYPAVLALGFLIGAPMWVGPALAAALVFATAALARAAFDAHPLADRAASFAAILSALCAALRYHTADTMSHGLAALCVTVALWALLRLAAGQGGWSHGAAIGLSGGMLFATRPASALALAATCVVAVILSRRRWVKPALVALVAAIPPVILWLAHQHAATGSYFGSAQSLYYALSDGPPGCFRYGLGEGIGCQGEHGTFVAANLADGYGALAALKTTGRRLAMHLSDALGFAPAFALVIGGMLQPRGRLLAVMVAAQIAAYVPFYFDGNYPGGGARFFADVIPAEHVLALLCVAAFDARGSFQWLVAVSLAGFALIGGRDHAQLREREGGRPMYEPARAPESGLLFVSTDHGFNLAYDPAEPDRVARWHGDGLDLLTQQRSGRPAFRYHYGWGEGESWVEPAVLLHGGEPLRIEAESLWPPRAQIRGWAFPRGAVLRVYGEAELDLGLPRALSGHSVTLHFLRDHEETTVTIGIIGEREITCGGACREIGPLTIPKGTRDPRLRVRSSASIGLDVLEVSNNR